jgi:hypothetical protein
MLRSLRSSVLRLRVVVASFRGRQLKTATRITLLRTAGNERVAGRKSR